MKLGLFAVTLAATASATYDEINPWSDENMFGQVEAESLDFNEVFDDVADFFVQVSSEDRDSLGQVLLQTKSMADDFIANMHPTDREKFDNYYAQVRESAFNWLSQIDEADRARVGEMLSQTSYGTYFMQQGVSQEVAGQINDYFSQLSWTAEEGDDEQFAQTEAGADVEDEDLDDMAEFLAQLDQDQIEKLNTLVETKREALGYNEDF